MTAVQDMVFEIAVRTPRLRYVVTWVVDRVLDLVRVPPPGLRSADLDDVADTLPVVLLYQPGAQEAAVQDTLKFIPALCRAASVRVVLVLDEPHLVAARRSGVVVELVPRAVHANRRLALLRRDYGATAIVPIPQTGLTAAELPQLAATLRSELAARASSAGWRRTVARTLRIVDPPVRR
jgi:hypothetical protein